MKINKILEEIKKYLGKDEIKEARKRQLEEIIKKLKERRVNIKSQIKSSEKSEEKHKLKKELSAILKLIKKSKKLI